MAVAPPVQFLDLRALSSDWTETCPVHGNVNGIIVFNNDLVDGAYCQQCLEVLMASSVSKLTFNANGGPLPEE
jgi:hypothetical protein